MPRVSRKSRSGVQLRKFRSISLRVSPVSLLAKGGTGVEILKKDLVKLTGTNVAVNIIEVKRVDVDAQLVAENVAQRSENVFLSAVR